MVDKERAAQMVAWRAEGKTLQWIGNQYGLTRERVRQIIKGADDGARKAAFHRQYDARKAAGRCVRCGGPIDDRSFVTCTACRKRSGMYRRKSYKPVPVPHKKRYSKLGIDWSDPVQVRAYHRDWYAKRQKGAR